MTDIAVHQSKSSTSARNKVLWLLGGVLYFLFLCWLYYPVLGSYFSNDDWVILWHSHLIPPSEPWRYFNMHTIWFYRPLQTMQFGLTWHLFGLNHAVYSIQSLAMHIGVCALLWLLFNKLFGKGRATISAVIFSVSCLAPDILLWAANYNTLQHALTTMIAANLFLVYVDTRCRRWLYGAIAAGIVNCFTKESSVNLPLILGVIWITRYLQASWLSPGEAGRLSKQIPGFFRDLLPFAVISLVYAAAHKLFYKNVETRYLLEYGFASPVAALAQLAHTTNISLFGYITQPLGYVFGSSTGIVAGKILQYGYVIPFAILALGFWRKSPAVVFAVLFAASLQFPTFALQKYNASRYYYLSTGAGVLLAAVIFWPPLKSLLDYLIRPGARASHNSSLAHRLLAYASAIALIGILTANIIYFQTAIGANKQQAAYIEQTFRFLQNAGPEIPEESLIVFRFRPNTYLHHGLGATEMIGLATGRRDITGVTNDFPFPDHMKRQFKAIPHKYVLDVNTTQPQLQEI